MMFQKLDGAFEQGERVRILDTENFGYTTVTVNRPLRNEEGTIVTDKKGNPKPDPKLKDTENIPLKVDVDEYFAEQVLPSLLEHIVQREIGKDALEFSKRREIRIGSSLQSLEAIQALHSELLRHFLLCIVSLCSVVPEEYRESNLRVHRYLNDVSIAGLVWKGERKGGILRLLNCI